MNNDTTAGKFDQLKGKIKQSVGEAMGDQKLANSGTADQVKGHAKEAWGNTKDAANAVGADAHARAETREAETKETGANAAHNVREKIASAAEKVKDAVSAKAAEVENRHSRTA